MRLVSLEIKGFKSFPEKTTINFNDSITGVVGPNGCGKSNIVDAIRWVLGEQKTSMLRSEKMENIIFNGTKQRRASSLAEVSLTFDNDKNLLPSEFNTITISRNYFRNGDSEYKLNGITCRLKDITSLFLDTGISSDSYAIIELGMVDEILNDKEHSRRRLFEQAAGISKYKARKKETLSKLEAAQLDLNRVDDLLFEIESNLKALESQARKTERYYKLKEEYRALSIELALFTLEEFKKSFDALQKQQEEQEVGKRKIETEIVGIEASLEKEKVDNIGKEKAMMTAQKELNEFITGIKQKENEKNILAENLKFKEAQHEQLTEQTERAKADLQNITSGIEEQKKLKQSETQVLQQLTQQLDLDFHALNNSRQEHTDNKARLEQQMNLLREKEREVSEAEKNITVRSIQKQNLQDQVTKAEEEFAQKQTELKSHQQSLQEMQQLERSKKDSVYQLTKAGDDLQERINNEEEELDRLREELRNIHRQLDARQNEFNLTRSFIDNMEGFPESIRFLKLHPEWATNAPLLSDIISCPAEYRVAIENFLEQYLNYYVVSDMHQAMNAVNLLSSAAKGRANFFVLNDFDSVSEKNISVPTNCISALSIVEAESKYRKLVQYLLNGVMVMKDESTAPSSTTKEATFISADGKFIRAPFGISGGQVGSFSGKRLGRIKNLEVLEQEIQHLKESSAQKQKRVQELQDEILQLKNSSTDTDLDRVREEHNEVKNQLASLQTKIESIELFFSGHDARRQSFASAISQLESETSDFNSQYTRLQNEHIGLQKLVDEMTVLFTQSEQRLNDSSSAHNQQNISHVQQQNKVTAIDRELEFRNQQLTITQQLIEVNNNELLQLQKNADELKNSLAVAEAEIIRSYERKESREHASATIEQVYYESRGRINELEDSVRNLSKNKEQSEHLLQEINNKMTELKIQLNSLKDRLNIEFKVEIESLMERQPDMELNRDEAQEKTERIRSRIETYGEINPMAMEAYNEMKQRHDFIIGQKNDLISAKESLLQTIDEIESTAKMKFMEAFNSIKENFVSTFKSLFTQDDECDLFLEDPSNVLESKIQITAKPKGKRPQIIDQLSGGEKTLTAISLLFALYLYKPAPFCILDEVDAPLDDANIDKFNSIIRDFSRSSQFILVTHNKQTMSSVDAIYGITMQEEGVSKVVPVDFGNLN